jgi:hypothetical protein
MCAPRPAGAGARCSCEAASIRLTRRRAVHEPKQPHFTVDDHPVMQSGEVQPDVGSMQERGRLSCRHLPAPACLIPARLRRSLLPDLHEQRVPGDFDNHHVKTIAVQSAEWNRHSCCASFCEWPDGRVSVLKAVSPEGHGDRRRGALSAHPGMPARPPIKPEICRTTRPNPPICAG